MSGYSITFGTLLRELRETAGFKSLPAFADYLSTHGLVYTTEAIGHWEKDRRTPPRATLLHVQRALLETGVITQVRQINQMLQLAGYNNLTLDEHQAHFPALRDSDHLTNLPRKQYEKLIGRDTLLNGLLRQLADPSAKPVQVISGIGGIGKTALAYETAARAVSAGIFDQMVWESAKTEEFKGTKICPIQNPVLNFPAVLASFARQLGLHDLVPRPPAQIEQGLRDYFRTHSVLVVLDNLETLASIEAAVDTLHQLVTPAALERRSRVMIISRVRLEAVMDFGMLK